MTGDGRNDVVLTTTSFLARPDPDHDYRVFVFPQREGGLDTPSNYRYGDFAGGTGLALLDLDGQHGLDVVVTSGFLQIFTSAADGRLALGNRMDTLAGYLLTLDVDRSGSTDLVSLSDAAHSSIYLNNRDGTLATVPWQPTPQGLDSLADGDLDGDGDADVALASGQGLMPNVQLFRNNGNGTLTLFASLDVACDVWRASGIGIGDVTGDDRADVVVAAGGNQPSACIKLFAGAPDGSFSPPVTMPSYDAPDTLRVTDVDLDGRADIVVLHNGWLALGVYFQEPDGHLSTEQLFEIPYSGENGHHELALGDFNGDGCTDAAIASINYGLVTLHGLRCEPVFADGFE